MLTIAQSLSLRVISGAPGQLLTTSLFTGVAVLAGVLVRTWVDVALAVGVGVEGDVGVVVGAGVDVEASVFIIRWVGVCVGAAPWLQATRIGIKKTTHSPRQNALFDMLPPFGFGILQTIQYKIL